MNIRSMILFVSGVFFWLNCVQLPIQYERIDHDKVRLLDFIYEPVEAGPGDTVELHALFAGKPIAPDEITWRVSYKVVKNRLDIDTSFEEQPLEGPVEQCTFSNSTSCISKRFVIPQNCLIESPMIPDDWTALLPTEYREVLPPTVRSFSKSQLLGMIAMVDTQTFAAMSQEMPDLIDNLPLVMQLLTAQIRIFADIKNGHRIWSDYSVNYNRKFARMPGSGIHENKNPVIDSVGIYKVKGSLMTFNRDNDEYEYNRLPGPDDSRMTVIIDKGYSYFVEVAVVKEPVTVFDTLAGRWVQKEEDYTAEWLFQMDEDETAGLSPNDLMNIAALGDLSGILAPPRKKQVERFTVWVQVTDSKLGILHRSQGSIVAEVHGRFEYTDAYLEQFK